MEEIRFNQQEIWHVEEMLDFFAIFGKDKRFSECKPVLAKQAKEGGRISMCVVMDYAEKKAMRRLHTLERQERQREPERENPLLEHAWEMSMERSR